MADPDESIAIELVYALPDEQVLMALRVPRGTTIAQAVALSGIREYHPEIDLAHNAVGIFAKRAQPHTVLKPGDRVEIYRPLIVDAKEVRRRRAALKKKAYT